MLYVTFINIHKKLTKNIFGDIIALILGDKNMKDENIKNYKKIIEYKEKLKEIEPYIKNKELVTFIEEDFNEIQLIQKKLKFKRIIRTSISRERNY